VSSNGKKQKKLCRLNDEDIERAKRLGLNPQKPYQKHSEQIATMESAGGCMA
jgi:hypothetical protein